VATTPTLSAASPKRFGKYYLVRKLAEGGMAEILLAKQVGPDGFERNIVLKKLLPHLSAAPEFIDMLKDEAKIAVRLTHQNIIQITELGFEEGCYFISMEYVPGEDFSTVLRTAGKASQFVPLGVVGRVILDAAQGLHFAHEFCDERGKPLSIVHRDVSPSNLYVTYQGQVKILDFGIARAESRVTLTSAGVVKGKYVYMSPEQARGERVDRRADVFSLGVCLYEALTQVRPFSRDDELAILNAVLKSDFRPPRQVRPEIPVELENIVMKAMASKADERYQTASALAQDLEATLAHLSLVANPSVVSAYLKQLFGEERVAQKTWIPGLDTLVNPPRIDSEARTQAARPAAISADAERTKEAVSEAGTAKNRPLSPSAFHWVLMALVLLAGAVGGWYAVRRNAAPPPPPVAEIVQPNEVAPAPAAEASPQEAAPVVEETPVAPIPTEPPPVAPVPKRVTLSEELVQRVVGRQRGPITRCFESHRSELPGEQGQVTVAFTILGSGKVTSVNVEGALGQSKVAECLGQRVSALRFPANTSKATQLRLPFEYQLQR
jgi:serine/threonine-protein kinase